MPDNLQNAAIEIARAGVEEHSLEVRVLLAALAWSEAPRVDTDACVCALYTQFARFQKDIAQYIKKEFDRLVLLLLLLLLLLGYAYLHSLLMLAVFLSVSPRPCHLVDLAHPCSSWLSLPSPVSPLWTHFGAAANTHRFLDEIAVRICNHLLNGNNRQYGATWHCIVGKNFGS